MQNRDKLQQMADERCACGHARRWHGELVHAPGGVGFVDGPCSEDHSGPGPGGGKMYGRCTCIGFRSREAGA